MKTHVFVTGREMGTTNRVAVDEEGNEVADELIPVSTQQGAMVSLTAEVLWYTLTCNSGRCDVRPTPGDETARYRDDSTAITIREDRASAPPTFRSPTPIVRLLRKQMKRAAIGRPFSIRRCRVLS